MKTQDLPNTQETHRESEIEAGTPLPHDTSDFQPKHIPQPHEDEDESGSPVFAQAKETAKERGKELAEKTGHRLKSHADGYLSKASAQVRNLQRAVDGADGRLNEQQPESLKKGTSHLSGGLDRVAGYLESKDSQEVLADMRQVVREHPVAVIGGLLAAGFVTGRLLRVGQSNSEQAA
ncbi:hypothetical protein [Roseibacillus ishigakijimensis]|uniref:Uncharacterized protein n=1 Tax=Roseibacillus ishigakijimensis TaxID=454146 RepID=A0A934RU54_9BACT|nr:hypothetical protein [Roseibacillus ishigakijimensis]MBK1834546.1 hypothetical protein [Roseibacillus ishigakijimensis]